MRSSKNNENFNKKLLRSSLIKFFCPTSDDRGIGLVETIAALGITVVILTSLVSLSVFTVRVSLQNKLLLEGSNRASQQLELVRAVRDSTTDWTNGTDGFIEKIQSCHVGTGGANCSINPTIAGLPVSTSPFTVGTGAEQINIYFRVSDPVNADPSSIDSSDSVVRIHVTVSWTLGTQTKYSYLYTDLTNWRN